MQRALDEPRPDRILFEGGIGRIGEFRRYPWQSRFADSGPAGGYLVVFPRQPVIIQHAGTEPVLADATRAMFYNQGQEYRRRSVLGRGDECEWFAFAREVAMDAVREHDPRVDDREARPFSFTDGPSDAATYLLQRRIVEDLGRGGAIEPLRVEEAMARLLARSVRAAFRARPAREVRSDATRRAHARLARACAELLSVRLDERVSLSALARALHVSPFHRARVFHRETGSTLHARRTALRLRASLARLADTRDDLARIAVDLGFATHSHFTAAFRRAYGVTPSAARRDLTSRRLAAMSKIVTA